jgi:hypothetical protein
MATAQKVTKQNHKPGKANDRFPVYSKQFNDLVDVVNELEPSDGTLVADTISESTAGAGVTIDGVLVKDNAITTTGLNTMTGGTVISPTVTEYTTDVTIASAQIVGTFANDLGHANGSPIVLAPGAGYALQFVSAVLIYDYDTAAYTGGAGDDLTFYINSVPVSASIATADLITKAGDTVIYVPALATDYVLGVNSTINLACTEVTQPGTAAGVIRVKCTYRVIETEL